ncbi:hypothetical protein N8774_00445 [Gammaproteobacteria bacterium]|jgi:hypothetical protein|nr:hypothetical protein [Gammaproteobacteria bacterium]
MVDIEILKKALESSVVNIKFESLKSGNIYDREYTLSQEYLPLPNHISRQSGDRLICFDIDFQKWEDILLTTIIDWKVVDSIPNNPYGSALWTDKNMDKN